MQLFRITLDDCRQQDLGFEGNGFTWCNRREEEENICERLDRFVANREWQSQFQSWRVYHRVAAYSDHSHILLHTSATNKSTYRWKLFRFEAMWIDTLDREKIISQAWKVVTGSLALNSVMNKINICSAQFENWKRTELGVVRRSLQKAQKKLECLVTLDPLCMRQTEHKEARHEVHRWLEREEAMWQQRCSASCQFPTWSLILPM